MDPLETWRAEFPILASTTYMISHSLGAMPRRASAALQEYTDTWASRGIRAWEEGWWEMPVTVGNLVGKIIGAGEGEVVMHQNVSICQSIVTSCFDWAGKRNVLVTDGLNFPSNDYIYYGLERQGARIHSVASPDRMTLSLERMLDAITEQTQLVSVSHVAFRSSYKQDLAAITRRAHQVGAMVVADIYQSAGCVPLNVRELGVDFATGRVRQMALRRPGSGLPIRAPGSLAETAARVHRLDGASRTVRLRRWAHRLCGRRVPLFEWHAQHTGSLLRPERLRNCE